jgi:prenyltransferase beta subunit
VDWGLEFESSHFIRAAGEEPKPLTFEPMFAGYLRNWTRFPTVDMTSQALHCLLITAALKDWCSIERRQAVLNFLEECWEDGFAISPLFQGSPTLYATLNALGVLKALLGIQQSSPIEIEKLAREVSRKWAERVKALPTMLGTFVHESAFVDDPDDPQPSIQALHCAASILWNVGASPTLFDYLSREDLAAFLRACRVDASDGFGFRGTPDGTHEGPCSTTTAVVIQLQRRSDVRAYADSERPRLWRFLHSCYVHSEGGFRVFPNQQPTLSATQASLRAIEALGPTGDLGVDATAWLAEVADDVASFVVRCTREDGGFAFHPGMEFHSNVFATRCALKVDSHLRRLEFIPTSVIASDRLVGFITSSFDECEGAFWGYGPEAASLRQRRLGDIHDIVLDRGPLTPTDLAAIALIDPFDAAYGLEALSRQHALMRTDGRSGRRLDARYSARAR